LGIFKSDPSTKLEAQLKTKVGMRADNSERLKAAEARLTEARALVEKVAIESDEAALDRALQVKRSCEDKVGALSAAIAKIGREITEIEQEIAKVVDQRTRSETAAAIETLARELDSAANIFHEAVVGLETALRACMPVTLESQGLTAFVMGVKNEAPPALAVCLESMRQFRNGVLDGHHAASLPKAAPEPVKLVVVPPAARLTIFALQNLKFVGEDGAIVCIGRNKRADVPKALAELAIEEHKALPLSDPRCRDLAYGATPLQPDQASCAWLGEPGAEPPPKTARPGQPIASTHFERLDRGPAYSMKVPRSEPIAVGQRNAEGDES
jgi:hypothetical protein